MTSTSREGVVEVAPDERPHLLRLEVVGVVVAGGEHERAEQDAPLHLGAEPRVARRAVHRAQVVPTGVDAQAVADAVEAREVARRLGGREDVVGGDGVARVRQLHGPHRAAVGSRGAAIAARTLAPTSGSRPVREVLLGHADAQALARSRSHAAS